MTVTNNPSATFNDIGYTGLGDFVSQADIEAHLDLSTPDQFFTQIQTAFEPDEEIAQTLDTIAATVSVMFLDDLIAPSFSPEPPESIVAVAGQYFSYTFNSANEEEDAIEITVDMGAAEPFIRFDEIARMLVIDEGTSQVGSYTAKFNLTLTTEYGVATTNYTIHIVIIPIKSYFVVDEIVNMDEAYEIIYPEDQLMLTDEIAKGVENIVDLIRRYQALILQRVTENRDTP